MSNSVKAAYLGLDETDRSARRSSNYTDWPGFTVAAVAEMPTALSSGTGLYGEYYDNSILTNLKLKRIDATIDFTWGKGSPEPWIDKDTFSVRWTGTVEPKTYGSYTFSTSSDDGVRLWVNGRLLIDNWETEAVVRNQPPLSSCRPGRKYDSSWNIVDDPGDASISLLWSPPARNQGDHSHEPTLPAHPQYSASRRSVSPIAARELACPVNRRRPGSVSDRRNAPRCPGPLSCSAPRRHG